MKAKTKRIKMEAVPLCDQQIAMFVKHYNKHGSFPGSKIPCIVTGKLTTCIGPWMKKKIKEFGGAENLLRNYKCRGALKSERQIIKPIVNKKRRNITKKLKNENKEWDIPKFEVTPPRPMSSAEFWEASKDQCFRPDIFLTNGRHCDGCSFFKNCASGLKCLPEYMKKDNAKQAKLAKRKK